MFAATDAGRGVWKAPAGIGTALTGALGLQTNLTDLQQGFLNQVAVNCLRQFPNFGTVIWGTRTIAGSDALGSQWKYLPIRRLALFIESSLYRGTQWAVFEPNAEPLRGQVRLSIGTFMQGLFLQGAFAGSTPKQRTSSNAMTRTTRIPRWRWAFSTYHGGVRAAVSGGVRHHPDSADGQPELVRYLRRRRWRCFRRTQHAWNLTLGSSSASNGTGEYVAAISKMSALKRTTEVVEHRTAATPPPRTSRRDATSTRPSRSSAG